MNKCDKFSTYTVHTQVSEPNRWKVVTKIPIWMRACYIIVRNRNNAIIISGGKLMSAHEICMNDKNTMDDLF